jgi:hypothetical protein
MPCNMLAVVAGQLKNLDALFSSEHALSEIAAAAAALLNQPITVWADSQWYEGYQQYRRSQIPTSNIADAVDAKNRINFVAEVGSIAIDRDGSVACRDGWNQSKIPTNGKELATAAQQSVVVANAYATLSNIILATGLPADQVVHLDQAAVASVYVNGVKLFLIAGYDGSFMASVAPESAASFDAAQSAIQAILPAIGAYAETGQVEQHAHGFNLAHETVHQL